MTSLPLSPPLECCFMRMIPNATRLSKLWLTRYYFNWTWTHLLPGVTAGNYPSIQPNAVLHFFPPPSFIPSNYYLNNSRISSSDHHRDLGVVFSTDLSWSQHYANISSKSYRLLGLLRRSFSPFNSVPTKKTLYLSLIKSQLSYASQIWRPHLIKDICLLERIQRRATKFILNDFTSDYKSRLISLKMLPLMMSFELSDIVFLISNLKDPHPHFDLSKWVSFSSCSQTRSFKAYKLSHTRASSARSSHFYFNRIPRLWNVLPPIDLDMSISSIKSQIKDHMWSQFLNSFDSSNPCTFHLSCPCNKCTYIPISCKFS